VFGDPLVHPGVDRHARVVEERGDHGRVAVGTEFASSREYTENVVAVDGERAGRRCGCRCVGEFIRSHGDSSGRGYLEGRESGRLPHQ